MTLRFGTDGVRGPASEFTDALVISLGQAAAQVLGTTAFVIGRDTRESGERLEMALAVGLSRGGAQPLSMGVVTTPAVAWICAQREVPGAVISASHNPWSDNGIKFFAAGGRKLSDELETALEQALDAVVARTEAGVETESATGIETDVNAVAEWCDAVASSVSAVAPMRIVIDCANGAASSVAPGIFRGLGLDVEVLHAQPNGRNINDACGSTYPGDLQKAVVASGAALGLAFDGDADRLLAVDERGELVDGDQLIALFARDLRERGQLAGDRVVVTVMSNLGFRLAMEAQGIEVVETPVGDRHVLEALARTSSSLGGEQSGHIVFADRATTGDGVLSGVQLVDLVSRAQTPLSVLTDAVMERFPQVLRNVRLENRRDDIAEVIADDIAAVEQSLGDRGRVLIRLSGTEPLVRVMVEAPTLEQAEAAADNLAAAVIGACSA
ncbi:MAG: phosphoglucosamine mutase [Actinobacteria bacterium]|nr:phosphoglucosamine mutase [Actinomycetota bacterium]